MIAPTAAHVASALAQRALADPDPTALGATSPLYRATRTVAARQLASGIAAGDVAVGLVMTADDMTPGELFDATFAVRDAILEHRAELAAAVPQQSTGGGDRG